MAVANANIPDRHIAAFEAFGKMPTPQFENLAGALSNAPPKLGSSAFADQVVSMLKGQDLSQTKAIVEALCSLFLFKERQHLSVSELIQIVFTSADTRPQKFALNEDERIAFEQRLRRVLALERPLGVSAKALDVMTEYEKTFCTARIVSDLRPVFDAAGKEMGAGFIVHNLKIGFHQDRQHREFFVALDESDLKKLQEIIVRAEEKAVAIKAALSAIEVTYISPS